jgi:putative membrane protein
MGWWMLFGTTLWILFIAVIVFLVLSRFSPSRSEPPRPPEGERPIEIARRRYAAGEITREEFEQLRQDLADSTAPGDQRP